MTLSLDTAYRSFGGEVEASSTPTICRLPDSRRHQLWAIAQEAARRLGLTLGRIGTLNFDCLIFDDFNQMEDGPARIAFGRCVQALHRRDRTAIVTAYRRPSQKTLTELGIGAEAVIEIPYLTEDEAKEIVRAANGDPEWWGRIAFTAGAQGHPQLVHAFVMGMAAREWPRSEVREIAI